MYASVKSAYFDHSEPAEFQIPSCKCKIFSYESYNSFLVNLDDVLKKIDAYMPLLQKVYAAIGEDFSYIKVLFSSRLILIKNKTKEYEEISKYFHNLTDEDPTFEQTLRNTGELFNDYQNILQVKIILKHVH
jgi:hypothetical protein